MKQLSIRLLAPFHTVQVIAGTVLQFVVRKLNLLFTLPYRLIGQWRLYLNYCPECNSVAPKTRCCDVCQSDTRAFFHWSDEIRKDWWKKYAKKHRIAM
ncbi:MAG TPA: hypothetical protein VGB71_06480 [Flavisolibacter sp.]|jgi:hypothetical protein